MARIIFFVWPMADSVLAGLKLARDLRSRGHDISYLGVADARDYVIPYGFAFSPIYEAWLPETRNETAVVDSSGRWTRFKQARARTSAVREFLGALASDRDREFQNLMSSMRPDLLIIHSSDFEVIIPSLLAFEAGISSVYLNSTFARAEDCRVPPMRSPLVPRDDGLWSMQVWLAWQSLKIQRNLDELVFDWLGLGYLSALRRTSRQIADRCGYPRELIGSTDSVRLKTRLPELIVCPPQLDFPDAERPGRHYLGSNIDLDRRQADFPWDLLDSRPLIYCALGTLKWFDDNIYRRFFQTVLDVAAVKTTFQWVVCVYDTVDPGSFINVPTNVIIVKRAPQLALLQQRCKIAIVHGGVNTMKECAYFSVPMIVFPIGFDQPGNAARIVYHGLGVRGDIRSVDANELGALVDRVDKDPYFQIQARLMGEALRADSEQRAVSVIETLIAE